MPLGVLYTYPNCAVQPLVYPYAKKRRVRVGCIVTYRRGAFGVARFDRQGNSYEPQIVKRATVSGLHVFFCVRTNRIFYCAVFVAHAVFYF